MPTRSYVRIGILLSLCTPVVAAAAEPLRLQLKVDADGVARHNAPVSATIPAMPGLEPGRALAATLTPAGGGESPIAAQVEPAGDLMIVRWIEPSLEPQAPRTYTLTVDPSTHTTPPFRFAAGDGYRDLLLGDRPVYRHVNKYDPADRENTYKPFYQVYALHDDGFITKGPGGKFPHHRGIFFGFKTPHGDFWHCPGGVLLQHRQYDTDAEWIGPVAARGVAVTDWVAKNGKAVLRDTQQVTAWNVHKGCVILDFEITVESLTGQTIPLGGDAHHAGFHFRAAQEVAEVPSNEKQGGGTIYTRPDGAKHAGNDVWENCPWLDGVFSVRGHRYGVTHMDSPTNPRPTAYSSRGYGRFGAYCATDVMPGKPLKLHYRLVIRDADANPMSAEQLQAAYDRFINPVRVTVVP